MKYWPKVLGAIIATILVLYFLWFTSKSLDFAVLQALLTPATLAGLVGAALVYAFIFPLTGWAWAHLLRGQNEHWPIAWLTAALATVQLAKYLPGNIAQYAGRAAIVLRKGMLVKTLTVTVIQETILTVAASVLVGLTMLAASGPGLTQLPEGSRVVLAWLVPMLLAAVVALASVRLPPDKLAQGKNSILRLLGRMGGLPGARIALPPLAIYSCNYLMVGLGLWLLARAAGLPATLDFPLVCAAFALSWLLGFLAPGAPAGLGVREGILVVLLAGSAPDEQLLAFVLLARLATMLGDLLSFTLGTLWFTLQRGKFI